MWVDKGKEFYNKHVKALSVQLYSTENEEKCCVVERWNRKMKEKMFKYFSANNTKKYIDILDEMVNSYNNTKHSSIKMTPVQASDEKNKNRVWMNLNGKDRTNPEKPKFSVGDKVRITKKKSSFEKGFTPRWTERFLLCHRFSIQIHPPIKYPTIMVKKYKAHFMNRKCKKRIKIYLEFKKSFASKRTDR